MSEQEGVQGGQHDKRLGKLDSLTSFDFELDGCAHSVESVREFYKQVHLCVLSFPGFCIVSTSVFTCPVSLAVQIMMYPLCVLCSCFAHMHT